MTPDACRQATEGLLRQQLQHVRGLREDVLLLEALRSAVSSSQHTQQIGLVVCRGHTCSDATTFNVAE
eukprot:15514-Eustigmatos_ZCMA.PRE.1